MLKVLPIKTQNFADLKCGEIYCMTAQKFTVSCCFCLDKVELTKYKKHFQDQHLHELENQNRVAAEEDGCSRRLNEESTVEATEPNTRPEIDKDELKYEYIDEKPIDFVELQFGLMATALPTVVQFERNDKKCEIKTEEKEPKVNVVLDADGADIMNFNFSPTPSSAPPSSAPPSPAPPSPAETYKSNVKGEDSSASESSDESDWQMSEVEDKSDDKPDDVLDYMPIRCKICLKTYETQQGLRIHLGKVHNINESKKASTRSYKEREKTENPQKPQQWKCDECDKNFRVEKNLIAHKYRHTGIDCDICGRPFTSLPTMQQHRIRHTGIKTFKCDKCESCFYTVTELKQHVMYTHTGIRRHVCEICGRRCIDKGFLKLHMRRHTGERPHKCEVCGKGFFTGNDLTIHSVTHTNIRSFVCDVCGASYKLKKSLRIHKRKHLEVPYLQCEICNKGFSIGSALRAHMRNIHTPEQICEKNTAETK